MSKSNVLELAKKLVAAIEKEDRKNKVMLKDIPVGGKFDTGIGRFIVLEREKDYTAVITPSGNIRNYDHDFRNGVRPFCILKSNIFVSKV